MNPRRSFVRKIIYLGVIALLLIPLFWLSQPASSDVKGGRSGPGGRLAQLREQYGLSEARLGDIDPTSETIKLATLGMRGVATVFLWQKANDYRMKKDWTNLSATLNQLSKLEPHFVAVWRHQGWNLSYNVSAEFDDYHDRYRWVIRGIEFLQKGIRYNRREPKLVSDVGWFISQKIGRADEAKQFRRLFKADDDFHGSRPLSERDNWLVGKEWFGKAEDLVEQGAILRGVNPILFHSNRPMCQMNYAENLEQDGVFQEKAKRAWKLAGEQWNEFGSREINTALGETLRLNDYDTLKAGVQQAAKDLDGLEPGLRERLAKQKRAILALEEREALDLGTDKRTAAQNRLAMTAQSKMLVTDREVAKRVSGPNQKKAEELVNRIEENARKLGELDNARNVVNYDSWRQRALVEQDPATLAAREYIYEGNLAFSKADLPGARENYDKGLAKWREVFDKKEYKDLANERVYADEVVEMATRYRNILEKRDEPFPKDFILADVLEPHVQRLKEEKAMEDKMRAQNK